MNAKVHQLYASSAAERRAQREYEEQRRVEDLRDNTVAIILAHYNTSPGDKRGIAKAFSACEAAYGPKAATLWKWWAKEVNAPKLTSVRAALRACNRDLGIV